MKRLLLLILLSCLWLSEAETQTYTYTFFWGRDATMTNSIDIWSLDRLVPLTYIHTAPNLKSTPGYSVTVFDGYDIFGRLVFYYYSWKERDGYFTTSIHYNMRAAQFPTMLGVDTLKGFIWEQQAQSSLPAPQGPYTWKVYKDTLW